MKSIADAGFLVAFANCNGRYADLRPNMPDPCLIRRSIEDGEGLSALAAGARGAPTKSNIHLRGTSIGANIRHIIVSKLISTRPERGMR